MKFSDVVNKQLLQGIIVALIVNEILAYMGAGKTSLIKRFLPNKDKKD